VICNEIVKNENFWGKHLKSNEHIGALKYIKEQQNKVDQRSEIKPELNLISQNNESLNMNKNKNNNLDNQLKEPENKQTEKLTVISTETAVIDNNLNLKNNIDDTVKANTKDNGNAKVSNKQEQEKEQEQDKQSKKNLFNDELEFDVEEEKPNLPAVY